MASQWLGNVVDVLGTSLKLPELGISERLAGWKPTTFTGVTPQSIAKGMRAWKSFHFDVGPKTVYAAEGAPEKAQAAATIAESSGGTWAPPLPAQPEPQPEVLGTQAGGNDLDALVNEMVKRGGYDPVTARQVASADFGRFWREFMEGGGGEPSGPSPEELALQRAREQFSAAYQPIYEFLDRMAGYLPDWKQQKEGELATLYQSQLGELETAKKGALSKLPAYRQRIRQMKAESVRDLYKQMRNMLQAGGVYLGTYGAADSSAAQAYGTALSKAAMKGSADIAKQAMQLMSEVDLKEQDIINTFNQQKAQLETWKAGELAKVADWFREKKAAIEEAKATATQQERLALAAQEQEIINQALARISALDQQAQQWDAAMQEWAINRLAQIDDLKAQYPQLAQWQPTEISVPQLRGLAGLGERGSVADWFVNPYALRRKREEEGLRGLLR